MKHFKIISVVAAFLGCVYLCQQIISASIANQLNKQDYTEINHIKYGLFSVEKWKEHLAKIVSAEISDLNLTQSNEADLKKHVEVQLNGLIDSVDQKIREKNKTTTKGRFKQAFINAFVDMKDIKSGIPEYADAIIVEMTKTRTEKKLKGMLQKRVTKYFNETFEIKDSTPIVRIYLRTKTTDIEAARHFLNAEIAKEQRKIYQNTWLLIALSIFIFSVSGLYKDRLPKIQFSFLVLTLLVLLIAGVTTPMIDLEAKISELSFFLLEHPVTFKNQVLYFQTKSILDVFWIMITHSSIEMKVVGILMVAFSVIFPLFKILSSVLFYSNLRGLQNNRWIQFFVFKSGKWSMTDVLIVAIFMAYIGFNGIIGSQFGSLSSNDQEMVILTTNGTSLQPGFYIFFTYTILALFLSEILVRNQKKPS